MSTDLVTTTAPDAIADTHHKRAVIYLRVSTAEQAHAADAAEGYSIPAQREACEAKAKDLGAAVVGRFVDRGESARSAARPELQRMLAHLAEHRDVDYVLVHKIDRLARNRADDVEIQLAIERAGARLVSVTESVDDTPSGRLVRNILSDLAEFYSANLATEILKGSTQKARMGGTPYKTPPGYLNVRQTIQGREIRTVEVDPEQARLMLKTFELYATGEYSLRHLHQHMTAEGLVTRATPKRPARPLSLSKFSALLRNRYYLGVVPYRGVEYPGNHPALISQALFDQVQRTLDEREHHSLKQRRHQHYLRGLLTCARCGGRLMYTTGRGRGGTEFDYYVCGKRHQGRGCTLPYLAATDIEERLIRAWPHWVRLTKLDGEAVGRDLHDLLLGNHDHTAQRNRAQRRMARLDSERLKLVQMAYADAIPLDLLKREQDRIARDRDQAERDLAEAEDTGQETMATYHQAQELMQRVATTYRLAGPDARRLLLRAFLDRIKVETDDEQATLTSPFREIQAAAAEVHATAQTAQQQEGRIYNRASVGRGSNPNPDPRFAGQGSIMNPLVEVLTAYSHSTQAAELRLCHAMALTSPVRAPRPSALSRPSPETAVVRRGSNSLNSRSGIRAHPICP